MSVPSPEEVRQALIVPPGKKFLLADRAADAKPFFDEKEDAEASCNADAVAIDTLQDLLFAEGARALLVVLQGVDTSGKTGTINAVFGATGPLGVQVKAFGKPTKEELDRDYLWRVHAAIPPKGWIGIFDRSHYEDVLVGRVLKLAPPDAIERRYDQINAFEKHLVDNNIVVLKFFLHISHEEQAKRLRDRLHDPLRRWKFNPGDLETRGLWDKYMAAYQDTIQHTTTPEAPWFVVPSDKKWFARLVVSTVLLETMKGLNLQFPAVEGDALAELKKVRTLLAAETSTKGGRSNGKPGKTNNASKAGVKA